MIIKFEFPREIKKIGDCFAVIDWRTGKPTINRRPKIRYDGEDWIGHRLSYHLNNGKIPRKPPKKQNRGLVLHSCDHRWCVNSKHLRLGTRNQNMKDFSERTVPKIRTKLSSIAKKRFSDPAERKFASERAKQRWNRPGERERFSKAMQRPKVKKIKSEAQKLAWIERKKRTMK